MESVITDALVKNPEHRFHGYQVNVAIKDYIDSSLTQMSELFEKQKREYELKLLTQSLEFNRTIARRIARYNLERNALRNSLDLLQQKQKVILNPRYWREWLNQTEIGDDDLALETMETTEGYGRRALDAEVDSATKLSLENSYEEGNKQGESQEVPRKKQILVVSNLNLER